MIEVKHSSELGHNAKKKISEVFVDAFGEYCHFFSNNEQRLIDAFEHMFVTEVFYVALLDGEVAGITACTDSWTNSVKCSKKEFIRHLGFFKGTMAGIILKRQFEKPPIEIGDKKANVGFVATLAKYRGKGVAKAILNHLVTFPQYEEYILEVADTNTPAIKLYEKLGYKEFLRLKHKHKKRSGINYLVYMKYIKPKADKHPA